MMSHAQSTRLPWVDTRSAIVGVLTLWMMLAPRSSFGQFSVDQLPIPNSGTGARAFAGSNGQQVGVSLLSVGHAYLWNGPTGAVIDLSVGALGSTCCAVSGTYQAGSYVYKTVHTSGSGRGGGGSRTYFVSHAALWHGSATSMVDLNPNGVYQSVVLGMDSQHQVGWQGPDYYGTAHATLWSGTAASAVSLEPSGFAQSKAIATSGPEQVGSGTSNAGAVHALLWHGTAASAIDLNASGLGAVSSAAEAVDGVANIQGGYVYLGSTYSLPHACLWHGTAASAIDLNPQGYSGSECLAVSGPLQAGYGVTAANRSHAMVWKGSSSSAIDLHSFLPAKYIASVAYGMDPDGSIVGAASEGNLWCPVIWRPSNARYVSAAQTVAPGSSGWSSLSTKVTMTSPYALASTIVYTVNGGAPERVSGASVVINLSTTGTNVIQAYATSGSQKTAPMYYTANVDLTPPTTSESYADGSLSVVASDQGSGVVATYLGIDGASAAIYKGPTTLANTTHQIEYWSVDRVGNTEKHKVATLAATPPTINSISPSSALSGTSDLTLTVMGQGFISSSYVQWNGLSLKTTFLSSSTLQATIPASDLAAAGTSQLKVTNPTPGIGTTAALAFSILQRATCTGGATNVGDGGQGTFDLSPVTAHTGFTLNGGAVHILTTSSTVFMDASGAAISSAMFFDNLGDGQVVSVVGAIASQGGPVSAWTIQLN
ncbi:MAG: IPT/TIG domain-containing protein [Fimbriimonas sp.]|nr:IPT/TIG domain-containing protein [Fimbriimonas sp.]